MRRATGALGVPEKPLLTRARGRAGGAFANYGKDCEEYEPPIVGARSVLMAPDGYERAPCFRARFSIVEGQHYLPPTEPAGSPERVSIRMRKPLYLRPAEPPPEGACIAVSPDECSAASYGRFRMLG